MIPNNPRKSKMNMKTIGVLVAILLGVISITAMAQEAPVIREIKYKINIKELDTMPDAAKLSPKARQKIIDGIVKGFEMWNNHENVPVKFKYEGETDAQFGGTDNINVVHVTMDEDRFNREKVRIKEPDALAAISQHGDNFDIITYGGTYLGFGPINLNGDYGYYVNFNPKNRGAGTSVQMVIAHEAGHALGLEHGADANSIMYKTEQKRIIPLSDEDISKVRGLFPSETEKPKDKKDSKEKKNNKGKKVSFVPGFGWQQNFFKVDGFETVMQTLEQDDLIHPDREFKGVSFDAFSRARAGLDVVYGLSDHIQVSAGADVLWGCKREFREGWTYTPDPRYSSNVALDLHWNTIAPGVNVQAVSPFSTPLLSRLDFHGGFSVGFEQLIVDFTNVNTGSYFSESKTGTLKDKTVGFSLNAGVDFSLWKGLSMGIDVGFHSVVFDNIQGDLTDQDGHTFEGELALVPGGSGYWIGINPTDHVYPEDSRPAEVDLSGITILLGLNYTFTVKLPGDKPQTSTRTRKPDDQPEYTPEGVDVTDKDEPPQDRITPEQSEPGDYDPLFGERCGPISIIRSLLKMGWINPEDAVEGDMLKPEYVKGFDKYLSIEGGINIFGKEKAFEDHLPVGKKLVKKDFTIDHLRGAKANKKSWEDVEKLFKKGWTCLLSYNVTLEDNTEEFHVELITNVALPDKSSGEVSVDTEDAQDQGNLNGRDIKRKGKNVNFKFIYKHKIKKGEEHSPISIYCYYAE